MRNAVGGAAFDYNAAAEWINPYPVKSSAPEAVEEGEESWKPAFAIPKPNRPNEPLDAKRARLVWASRKRGILETDLLLSTFVSDSARLADMSPAQLDEYDALLEENDWDIYYWCTGAKHAPKRIREMSIFPALVEHCKNKGKQIRRMPDVGVMSSGIPPVSSD
ncbi:Succinate dehydrogenase assembly factor 2 mitochondrial [Polyrhizophydium stewartii]|uniref:Succinate dehydrogenase assembly factor 2, mitochondrial n=1 Tax=Polyrhizophydium stewartii TaxID=2732419 RepID=A0ABR4N739_9FUNG